MGVDEADETVRVRLPVVLLLCKDAPIRRYSMGKMWPSLVRRSPNAWQNAVSSTVHGCRLACVLKALVMYSQTRTTVLDLYLISTDLLLAVG